MIKNPIFLKDNKIINRYCKQKPFGYEQMFHNIEFWF